MFSMLTNLRGQGTAKKASHRRWLTVCASRQSSTGWYLFLIAYRRVWVHPPATFGGRPHNTMSVKRSEIIVEGELFRFQNDVPKTRYLILTHGALYEYKNQDLSKLHHTYELTTHSAVRRVPRSLSFELSVKGNFTDTVRFAMDANQLGDRARDLCADWINKLQMLVDIMASEERALETSACVVVS